MSPELMKLRAQVVAIQGQLQEVLEAIDRLEVDPVPTEVHEMTTTGEFSLDQELRTIPDFPQIRCVHTSISRVAIMSANPGINYYDVHTTWPTVEDLLSLSKPQIYQARFVGKKRAEDIFEWMEKHGLKFKCERYLV